MKTTILVIAMLFIVQFTYAQYTVDITDYGKLNESQLHMALKQTEQDIETGKTLTSMGSIGFVGGAIGMIAGAAKMADTNYQEGWGVSTVGGLIMSLSTIPLTWGIYKLWKGNADRDKIQIHLMKFQSSNALPESVYGTQLTFKF